MFGVVGLVSKEGKKTEEEKLESEGHKKDTTILEPSVRH